MTWDCRKNLRWGSELAQRASDKQDAMAWIISQGGHVTHVSDATNTIYFDDEPANAGED